MNGAVMLLGCILAKDKTQFFKFYPHPTGEKLKSSTDYWERTSKGKGFGKMKYDYKQLAELLGADRLRIANIVSYHHIEKEVTDNKVYFSESAVAEIKKYLNTRPRKKLYKVSVFNEDMEKFIVKSVCRPYEEARELVQQLTAAGFLARYSPHQSKKYYYE